jgi:hypothetical protein
MRSKTAGIVDDPRLEFEIGVRFLELQKPELVLANLLPIADRLPFDPDCQVILARAVSALGQGDILERSLELWRKQDTTYAAHLARGEFHLERAEAEWIKIRAKQTQPLSRGSPVPDFVRSMLERARQELLRAVEINPRDWQARVGLISIASALNSSREELNQHFTQAIAANPASREAWRRRLQYLSPFHQGSVDDVARFIDECVETGRWQDGIPQLTLEAVQTATCDPQSAATRYETFRNERLWKAISRWRIAAEEHAWVADRWAAINCFVLWGTAGGHFGDVATLCERLRKDASQNNYDVSVFESHARFRFLHDLIFAEQQAQHGNPEAAILRALDSGRFSDATRMLEAVPPAMPRMNIAAYRKAAELGEHLLSNGALDLTSDDASQILLMQVEDQSEPAQSLAVVPYHPISSRDGALCWQGQPVNLACDCYIPLGFLRGQFSGELELPSDFRRVSVLLHSRALRDVVHVNYLPSARQISIVRGRRDVARVPLPDGPISFRFEFLSTEDLLEPAPGLRFRLPVLDDAPSGIGIEVETGPSEGVLQTRNLYFELGNRELPPRSTSSRDN